MIGIIAIVVVVVGRMIRRSLLAMNLRSSCMAKDYLVAASRVLLLLWI